MSIRLMTVEDAAEVARLSAELGYEVGVDKMRLRIARLVTLADNDLLVADAAAPRLAGWIHLHAVDRLLTARYAEVGGLVVDARDRGRGVGAKLLSAGESWARQSGFGAIRLRSGQQRVQAHQFYLRQGYIHARTGLTFEKALDAAVEQEDAVQWHVPTSAPIQQPPEEKRE